jgi:hypothetical protein
MSKSTMNRLSLIIQREYLTRVRKKSFIILTVLMPFLMVAISLIISMFVSTSPADEIFHGMCYYLQIPYLLNFFILNV